MELTADEIARVTGGRVLAGPGDARVTSLANDSRTLEPGACFVALVAFRDGHDFVEHAFARGATVALVTRPVDAAGGVLVLVDDALDALAALAIHVRAELPTATVVGITGSTGKTSTKELTASTMRGALRVHASPGSFNAEIGLPITMVGAPADTEVLVLELGARMPGDIRRLAAVARPTVGVVTNVGLAHAELLGSAEGVAREKGDLLAALPAGGLAVLDAGDAATSALAARTDARVLLVSVDGRPARGGTPDVRARGVRLDEELRASFTLDSPWGSGTVRLNVRGAHQVVNATLAAAVALASEVPFDLVAAGLAAAQPTSGRMDIVRAGAGPLVLDDAYNASPASMAAAVEALAAVPVVGKRVAVLGEMRELGPDGPEAHAALGQLVADAPVDLVVVVGPEAAPLAAAARAGDSDEVVEVADAAGALEVVRERVAVDDAVLVKGSRAVGLDVVVRALTHPEDAP